MTERRPATSAGTVLGFLLVIGLVIAIVAVYLSGARPAGWRGGEFGMAIVWVAVGSPVLGALLLAFGGGTVRGLGRGMLAGGLTCLLLGVVAIIVFFVAFAHSGLTF